MVCIGPDARTRQRPSSSLLHQFSQRQGRRRAAAVCVGDTPRRMTSLGLGAYRYVLTVPGRRTGLLYSTPVNVITVPVLRTYISVISPAATSTPTATHTTRTWRRALSPPPPGPGIAELIDVMSKRAHLKERIRDDGQHRDDKCEHDHCEECVHRPPFVACRLPKWPGRVIGASLNRAAKTTDCSRGKQKILSPCRR